MWLHYKPKQVLKGWEREKIKIIVSFRSYPKFNRKLHKNNKKFKKQKKYDNGSFQAKIGRKKMKNRENKNYRFVSFRSNTSQKR